MSKVLLVDCYNILYRGHFAMHRNPLRAPDGTNTSGLYHLVSEILDMTENRSADITVAVFDYPAPSFRKKIYPEYKSNRPPMPEELILQSNLARKLIPALGIPLLEEEGLEADDIIASLTAQALKRGDTVEILSTDKDLLQLLADGAKMLRPGRSGTPISIIQREDVENVIGVSRDKVVDYLSLTGDSSDNIPGAKGIGPKSAQKLLRQFGSVDDIYENIDDVLPESVRNKLQKSIESVYLSRKLISLQPAKDINASIDDLSMNRPDESVAVEILTKLGMNSILRKLHIQPAGDLFGVQISNNPCSWCTTHIINSVEELERFDFDNSHSSLLALDTESTSVRPFDADIVGISFASSKDTAVYIPLAGPDSLPVPDIVRILKNRLEGKSIAAQNGKYDIHILDSIGLDIKKIKSDPMIADYLIMPERQSHSLSELSYIWLNKPMMNYSTVLGNAETLADVDTGKVAEYCGCDSATAFQLAGILMDELEKDPQLLKLYDTLELPLVTVLARMEKRGVAIDLESLNELRDEFSTRIRILENNASEIVGYPMNLSSPAQVSAVLFDTLGLPPVKKTRKGANSSSIDVLEKLRGKHEFVETVIEHRELSKLLNTYIGKLPLFISDRDGLVHTSFSQTVTATGRLSSSNPNLQNIPVRTSQGRKVRKCFIPGIEGNYFITADYSQIELRVLAHLAGPGNLRDAYSKNLDIHSSTALALFGDDSPEHRRKAKEVNFSILYGISPWGLSNRLNISRGEASGIINRYLATYPELEFFFKKCIADAEATGETRTILGRKRNFKEFVSAKGSARNTMERMVVNTIVQGSAADIIKIAMLRVDERLKDIPYAGLVLQVHDELVATAPEDRVEEITAVIRKEMESAYLLEVPLIVETGKGRNWLEAGH
ncbi:MAG: DNA polymerase I [Candidatus Aegiribacteria sp.]|nr:DNA polymerase I [Candidatus Aegiribacteria sp.]